LYRTWREDAPRGIRVAAAAPGRVRDIRTTDRLESMRVRPVSADFFSVLGVDAAVGRTFDDSAVDATRAPPAVLSDRAWQTSACC